MGTGFVMQKSKSAWVCRATSLSNLRGMTGDTLPFARFRLNPGIGPTLVAVDVGSVAIDTFASPRPGCDGCVSINTDLYVADPVVFPLAALQIRKQFTLVVRVAAHVGSHEGFREQGRDCGSVAGLGPFGPLILECCDGCHRILL